MATGTVTPAVSAFREIAKAWAPPPKLTVSQWADENRRLSSESSAKTGQWVTRPYQREPQDVFTDPRVHTIVLMVARQTLKTEVINNCLGYLIDKDPGPTLIVQYRDTDCKRFSKIRLAPMLRDTPCLHGKVSEAKSRDSANTFDYKAFNGGHVSIVASSSPGNLAALPIRYVFCDEIDKYPVSADKAGDPISLAQGRQEEFWNRKTVLACTPTIKGESRIHTAYLQGDQREYEVKCPFCSHMQVLKWAQVKWDSKAPRERMSDTARYECEHCNVPWTDVDRLRAVRYGAYRATAPFNGVASFRVSGLCRTSTTIRAMVEEFLNKKDNPESLKTFINEQLAECWETRGEAPEWRRLYERSRSEFHKLGIAAAGVLFLTAGADVQRDRIEVGIRGWGRNKQSWVVDYVVLEGKTSEPDVWLRLTEVLGRTYPNVHGIELQISKLAIDSGYATQDVYAWVRQQGPGRVMAIKGMPIGHQSILGQPSAQDINWQGHKVQNGVQVWPVGVAAAKSELYGWLGLPTPTESELESGSTYLPGYCHLSEELAEEFYEQLTAEELVSRKNKGQYTVQEWVKRRERNEVLDAYGVYARAAAAAVGLDRLQEAQWVEMERRVAPKSDVVVPQGPPRSRIRGRFKF